MNRTAVLFVSFAVIALARQMGKEVVVEEAPPPAESVAQTDDAIGGEDSVPEASPYRASRMIIKNAELRLLVEDTRVAVDQVTQVAEDTLGYVLSSRNWYKDDFQYATITLGVPTISAGPANLSPASRPPRS